MKSLSLPLRPGSHDYVSFTDETDLTAKYMVIGGITCAAHFAAELDCILQSYHCRMPYGDRLEWKQITAKNQHVFADLIREFCLLNSEHLVDFHALVVDSHKFDHETHNNGDREVGFDKMMFQSFFAVHKRYPGCEVVRCFHGKRDSRHPISALQKMLNAKCKLRSANALRPYASVKYHPLKGCLHLQIADLLIGCVGAKWNQRKGYKAGSPKDQIACLFEAECPASKLSSRTPYSMKHFDIWEFKMDGLRA